MAEAFDPYHTWLGIPPEQQPPDHYRLLGIRTFETNPDVIENAADRQMAHLRTFQSGRHSVLSQKLLNEVAAAKVCLLNPEKQAAYDEKLRQQMQPTPPQAEPELNGLFQRAAPANVRRATRATRATKKSRSSPVLYLGVAMVVAVVVVAAVLISRPSGETPIAGTLLSDDGPQPPQTVGRSPGVRKPSPPKTHKQAVGRTQQAELDEPEPPDIHPDSQPPSSPPDQPAETEVVSQQTAEPVPEPPPQEPSLVLPPPESMPGSGQSQPFVEEQRRLALPSDETQRQITGQLEQVYDLAKDRQPSEKLRLAGELFNLGINSEKPDEKYVLLDKAAALAAEGGNAAWMLRAVDTIGASFEVDVINRKAEMLDKFAAEAKSTEQIRTLVESVDGVIDEALADERYELAAELADRLYRACRKTPGREFRKQALQRRKQVQTLAGAWKKLDQARARLKTTPEEPDANLALGRWYAFTRGDWQKGLPHLAKADDDALKKLARQELTAPPAKPDGQIKLADAWWDLAETRTHEEKDALLVHSSYWYEMALPKVTSSLVKVKIVKRLGEIAEQDRADKTQHRPIVQEGNVALASNGTTVSGNFNPRCPGSALIDGETATTTVPHSYAESTWPCEWIITFNKTYRLQEIRLKLWDRDKRYYRYAVATSAHGKKFIPLVDRSKGQWRGWQEIRFPKRPVKFVKIFGLYNNGGECFHVIEFEAYCNPPRR